MKEMKYNVKYWRKERRKKKKEEEEKEEEEKKKRRTTLLSQRARATHRWRARDNARARARNMPHL